ncbi:heparin lyase I family protein [Kiloniella majae]|uniref:heparin lyase I family protein n=1 Tax=Kiloniella majae TaxID=1938558 RepID=UPI001302177E|nr:heparin lyase I family protein [Kiloniella majae]
MSTDPNDIKRGNFGDFSRSLIKNDDGYQILNDSKLPDRRIFTQKGNSPVVEYFEINPGDCGKVDGWDDCKEGRERAEIKEKESDIKLSKEYWYSWDFFIPKDIDLKVWPTKVCIGQFHQDKSNDFPCRKASVIWMFQIAEHGGLYLDEQITGKTRGYTQLITHENLQKEWHNIIVHAKWSTENTGKFSVWVNGIPKANYEGITTTTGKPYFKYGLYRTKVNQYADENGIKGGTPKQSIYYANVIRSSNLDGILSFNKNLEGYKELKVFP